MVSWFMEFLNNKPLFIPASRDFLHVISTPQTSTSAKMSEQETGKWHLFYYLPFFFFLDIQVVGF